MEDLEYFLKVDSFLNKLPKFVKKLDLKKKISTKKGLVILLILKFLKLVKHKSLKMKFLRFSQCAMQTMRKEGFVTTLLPYFILSFFIL